MGYTLKDLDVRGNAIEASCVHGLLFMTAMGWLRTSALPH